MKLYVKNIIEKIRDTYFEEIPPEVVSINKKSTIKDFLPKKSDQFLTIVLKVLLLILGFVVLMLLLLSIFGFVLLKYKALK